MSTVLAERVLRTSQRVQLVKGDLTSETTEAIVNAANAQLIHGGGVAGAIARRGGPTIEAESARWMRENGPVLHERPAWTSGGNLAAKYVIHAVGPIWGEGDEDRKLAAALAGALGVADELQLKSISVPAISTGIFGFPRDRAAEVLLGTMEEYFARRDSGVKLIRLVLFDDRTIEAFMPAWERWAGNAG